MKRLLSTLLAVFCLAILLSSCSDNNDPTDSTDKGGLDSVNSTSFPPTVILDITSTSPYAREQNTFYVTDPTLVGQCTWYVYGRVIELANGGYLGDSVNDLFYNAFWGERGRDAQNWPDFLGGTWEDTNITPLPLEKRRKGLVAVWKGGTHGHVGFVEEVSEDKSQYRLSDFNRSGESTYCNLWYYFEGTSDKLLDCYPYFLELELGASN